MSLRNSIPRVAMAAVAGCVIAGGAAIAVADSPTAPEARTAASPGQRVGARYFDIEDNKAVSLRALGRSLAVPQATHAPGPRDLEAYEARDQLAP